ncbi:MAG: NAD(P)-dependent oxidoreductase [Patescibacteria group bacterium]
MKISFFEVAQWEKSVLQNKFPDANFTEDKLMEENVSGYKESEIISCFVYSDLNSDVLSKFENLKFIAVRGTGYDRVDQEYCKNHNIKISNVPEYGSRTVAEYTFALILNLTRKIYQSINQSKVLDFNHSNLRGIDLYGKTIGIIGFGKIGKNVAEIARGFGMKIIVSTRTKDEKHEQEFGLEHKDLGELLQTSDIVTLHLPLTPETKHIINQDNILNFKKGSYLINTARGGLIDTEAVILGLEKNILGGVALDVLEEEKELTEEAEVLTSRFKKEADYETLFMNHILLNHPKVLITPHNAFNSNEALARITQSTIGNIEAYLEGNPKNLV